eukprot:c1953_g1_i1.p1 GENE.c1953_g1_i1~~c1953_g1_i1.p1  ORF type:complete len:103 (+),score=49.88 c1953_g1_i1:41-349(+)
MFALPQSNVKPLDQFKISFNNCVKKSLEKFPDANAEVVKLWSDSAIAAFTNPADIPSEAFLAPAIDAVVALAAAKKWTPDNADIQEMEAKLEMELITMATPR